MSDTLLIGWTTVGEEADAQRIARDLVDQNMAACVQIDADVQSIYRWKGTVHSERERRLTVKFMEDRSEQIAAYFEAKHPYDVHEWIVLQPEHVSPDYLNWAR
jgi:periplasmic divalent cation tolerance protein